jgi:tetratricopeptide (TPR) repeat protein
VLKSSGFARNERLSRFLSFVVEQHLQGRSQELKESVLGAEVFGRQPGYNSKFDPVVRTEARRLRARLAEYYIGAGAESAIVIDLPKGGYVPVIRPATRTELKPCRQEVLGRRIGKWVVGTALIATAAVLIAAAGGVRLGPGRHSRALANSAAYDTYLRARASEMRPAVTGVELSIELFEQAIAKDRFFAPAYAGLAAMEAARSAFDRFSPSERDAMIAKGWAAAEKAIQLNAAISDAHDALGMMQARSAQWPQAERSFRHAIQISPRDVLWRDHFAMFLLMPLGRIEEAIEQLRSAEEIDPRSPEVHYALSLALRAVRRFDEADFHCSQAAQDEQEMSGCWAETLMRQGKPDDALRVVEDAWNGHLLRMGAEALGLAYARAGRRADAERMAATLPRPACKAVIFAALGDKERALKVLDQMVPMGPTRVGRDLIAPEYAVLKGDGRLAAIRKKTGLPE